jgi:hypothetical protein
MTEQDRDYLMWKNGKGRYSEGGKHYGAKAPQEGGVLAPEYMASAASRPQAMYRSHNGAVVSSAEPIESLDTPPYAPPRMISDPFDKSAKAKAGALEVEQEPIIQDAEAQDAFTPIACFIEGEPAGSVQ